MSSGLYHHAAVRHLPKESIVDPDDPDDKVSSLMCGHTFHEHCVSTYEHVKGLSRMQLPCPVCKITGTDCVSRAVDGTAVFVHDGTGSETEDYQAHSPGC